MRLAPLRAGNRDRLSGLLLATGAFHPDEVDLALALFDEACPTGDIVTDDDTGSVVGNADYEFVGAFDASGILVGYACFGPTPATGGTYDLYWLAVDPAAQGRGAGRALVQWVEQALLARGARLLVVETSSRPDYASTRNFYARGGFAEAARVRDFYAPADDRIILTTRLMGREVGVATR
ncbi:MAG: GNAT family N-acetyltransferase [bacterium]